MIRSGGAGTKLVLAGLGWVALTRGLAYAPWTNTPKLKTLTYIEHIAPLWVYSMLWGIAAVLLVAAVIDDRRRPLAISVFIFMSVLWTFSYLSSWLWLDQQRAWITACYYIGLGLVALGVGLRSPRQQVVVS